VIAYEGRQFSAALLALSLLCACASNSSAPAPITDTTTLQSNARVDVGVETTLDDAISDSDSSSSDTVQADSSSVRATDDVVDCTKSATVTTAWGTITGACGALASELASTQPTFLVSEYNFSDACAFDPSGLASGPNKRYEGDNAGGSSLCSEVMSMQLLADCDEASIYKTEKQIAYTSCQGAITDYIAEIDDQLVGVSVTRAYKGPSIDVYSVQDATDLLEKKLAGVNESSSKVKPSDKWLKQVLHIWTLRKDWVPLLKVAWQNLDAKLRGDTIVWVTVEQHPDGQTPWIVPDQCGLK